MNMNEVQDTNRWTWIQAWTKREGLAYVTFPINFDAGWPSLGVPPHTARSLAAEAASGPDGAKRASAVLTRVKS